MSSSLLLRAGRLAPLAVVMLALLGCPSSDQPATAAGPGDVGGTMVVSTPGDAGSLLPMLVSSAIERQLTDLLYDHLADIGPELMTVGDKGFKPQLADRWTWAPDSLSITFHLNPAARWHDGRPVRASDVRFSFATLRNPATGSPNAPLVTNVDSVSVRDSATLVVWYKSRTPEQFYDFVYQVPVVPEHILGNTPPEQLKTADVGRGGIGSGRFRLAKWDAGQRIELVADTANYRGRPKLDRIIYSIAPDFTASVTRFFAGDADFHEGMRPEHLTKLATDTTRTWMKYPNLQYAYMAFNLVDPANKAMPHPLFGDRTVRRALAMAVDRRAMLRNVFDTLGEPSYGPFPRALPVADTTLPQLAYDTVKARQLLDSAGWVMGPGAVRVKNGRRLAFSLTVPSSSAPRVAYSVLLQEAFRRVGADVTIDQVDFGAFAAKQGAHGFDAELAVYSTDPSVSGFKQSWTTPGIAIGQNFPSYSNPSVDALFDSATASFDFSRTRAYARRAFETIIEDAPGIWLYQPLSISGIHRRIRPTGMRADGWTGMTEWWIPAAKRSPRDQIGLRIAQ